MRVRLVSLVAKDSQDRQEIKVQPAKWVLKVILDPPDNQGLMDL